MKIKRHISLILAVLMILQLFAGCGKEKSPDENSSTGGPAGTASADTGGGRLTGTAIPLPDGGIYRICASDDGQVYCCGGDGNGGTSFYQLNISDNTVTPMAYTTSRSLSTMGISPEGNIVSLEYEDDGDGNFIYTLVEADSNGQVLSSLDLTPVTEQDGTVITGIMPVEGGTLVSMFNNVFLVNDQGAVEHKFETYDANRTIVKGAEGQILLCGNTPEGYIVDELAPDLKSKTAYVLENNYNSAFDGRHSGGVYLNDGVNIYSVDYKSGQRTVAVDILKSGMNASSFVCVGENTFLTLERDGAMLWTPASGDAGETVTLKMAANGLDGDLYAVISEFNKSGSKYVIEVEDYSTYATGADADAGLTRLNTEIISGNVPDIFDLSTLPAQIYKSKGLLEDLKPFIENDDELGLDSLVPSAVEALSDNGSLYTMVPAFKVMTGFTSPDYVKSREEWTTAKFLEMAKSAGDKMMLSAYDTRDGFLEYLLIFSADDFATGENGAYNFNNSDFIELLKFAATLPEEPDYEGYPPTDIYDGKQLLSLATDGEIVLDIIRNDTLFRKKCTAVGFPSSKGGRYALFPYMSLGMASTSENKEGVWEFFSFLLRDEYQRELGDLYRCLSMRNDILKEYIVNSIQSAPDIQKAIVIYRENGQEDAECQPPSPDMESRAWDIINNIDCVAEYDEFIYSIVTDEAAAFFAGERSAEEAAEIIQSRVSIYVAEQS